MSSSTFACKIFSGMVCADVVVFRLVSLTWSFKCTADQETSALGQTQLQVIEVLCEKSLGTKVPPVAGCTKALRTIFLHYESNDLVSTLIVYTVHLEMFEMFDMSSTKSQLWHKGQGC